MAPKLSPRTRGVIAVIIGMAAAGFAHSISGGLGVGWRAAVTGAVAAAVTVLVIPVLPRAPGA